MTKKQLSKERLRVRREMDEWSLREAGAVLGLRTGACTPEQADFAKAEVKKLNDEMRRLNKPAAKQLRWVGQGFAKK